MNELTILIGKQLKRERSRQRLTQEELAKMINTTKATIWKYEHDTYSPTLEVVCSLASSLNIHPFELMKIHRKEGT